MHSAWINCEFVLLVFSSTVLLIADLSWKRIPNSLLVLLAILLATTLWLEGSKSEFLTPPNAPFVFCMLIGLAFYQSRVFAGGDLKFVLVAGVFCASFTLQMLVVSIVGLGVIATLRNFLLFCKRCARSSDQIGSMSALQHWPMMPFFVMAMLWAEIST